jgi:hypothetical protein
MAGCESEFGNRSDARLCCQRLPAVVGYRV